MMCVFFKEDNSCFEKLLNSIGLAQNMFMMQLKWAQTIFFIIPYCYVEIFKCALFAPHFDVDTKRELYDELDN
jgi:hypothetical protein